MPEMRPQGTGPLFRELIPAPKKQEVLTQAMNNTMIPDDYHSALNLHDTQVGIKTVKDFFQGMLAERLNLLRVSAPLFVDPASGLNDNLNGVERPVDFDILEQNGRKGEVVQSLAKWKRYALKKYGFQVGEGLYTDMSAIRRDEVTDNIHSIYVDQWDWEKIIRKEDRNLDTLQEVVRDVYRVLRKTEKYMAIRYDYIEEILPHDIYFITSQELEQRFPDKTPKEREYIITRAKGAVCIMQMNPPRRTRSGLRRLEPQRRYPGLLPRARHCAGAVLHGNPCRCQVPGRAA